MYCANSARYSKMPYRRLGRSGLKLPAISLGLWQNFGVTMPMYTIEEMIHTAFDGGIVHFDLANNYGQPVGGSAEENFGRVMANSMRPYRDELCISTKAGYGMWAGPYGCDSGSRKYLISSLDQSLRRMQLDYVDIFYHHRPDPDTPMEETALALDHIVRSGRALYVGISNYNRAQTTEMLALLRDLKTPFVVNQPSYSMLNRWIESDGLDKLAVDEGFGLAVFCPLQSGLLTDKYLDGNIPEGSRAARTEWLRNDVPRQVSRLNALNEIAKRRGQKLSQMALAWCLSNPAVTTVLTGASSAAQIKENLGTLDNMTFTDEEKAEIEALL